MRKTKIQNLVWLKPLYYILGLGVIFFLYKFLTGAKSMGAAVVNTIATDVQSGTIGKALQQNNVQDVRATAVLNIANDIYSAFYKDSLFGWGEDEAKAVEAFNRLQSINEAKSCAVIYREMFGKGLYTDFQKFVHFGDYKALKTVLLNAIKGL